MKSNQRVTIQDIAASANVSKATVSRVLNNSAAVHAEKRRSVLDAMGRLGYRPSDLARGLASGRSMTIGILTQNIGTPFFDAITNGLITSLTGTGYSPIFVDGRYQQQVEAEAIEILLGRGVDGLVLVGGDVPLDRLESLRGQLPTMIVARELSNWGDQCIAMDNFQAGYEATNYLIGLGHTEIAHIRGNCDHEDATRRYRGYLKALDDADLKCDQELVYQGNFYGQCGALAIESWLMRGKNFSAIFAANDLSAFGARLALYRRGIRVPEEVSIVGVDDQLEASFMTPPLTTIRQPAIEMGEAAGKAIVSLIQGKPYELAPFHPELIRRESATALR